MAAEVGEQGGKKKRRKRVKAILAKIKDQMEFYFSDSNLHKDRFLKKAIDETNDGYIDLNIFLKFNRIRALTDEVKMIADAVAYKSDLLQVNEDKTKVKRVKPLPEQTNVDERTVYVEHLPASADHDWVRRMFSACGKVAYVSLPKFRTTGDLKGFGFVEFETVEGAKMACEDLNNPPADAGTRIGMFPKSRKQLDALSKKLPEDQIQARDLKNARCRPLIESMKDQASGERSQDQWSSGITETEEKAKAELQSESHDISDIKDNTDLRTDETTDTNTRITPVSGGILKRVKRTRTKSEGSLDESFSGNDSSPQKRKRHEVSFDLPEETDKSAAGNSGKKKTRNRKNRSKTVDVVVVSQDSAKEKENSDVEKGDSDKTNDDSEVAGKRRKVDQSKETVQSDEDSTQVTKVNSDQDETKTDSANLAGKKRKMDSPAEENVKDAENIDGKKRRKESIKDSSVSQSESEKEARKTSADKETAVLNGSEVTVKKKKHRFRRKQHNKEKPVPELRVIPKAEWLCLREEYLRLQKASMTMLKRTLAEMKDNTNTEENEKEKGRHEIEFIPDVIVKVTSDKPLVRKTLKADLGPGVDIAYIELKDGQTVGHIRCKDAHSARQITAHAQEGLGFSLLSGEDERLYWEKLKADQVEKHSKKTRSKKRGQEKWMDKAQKASIETVERKHIKFDDE